MDNDKNNPYYHIKPETEADKQIREQMSKIHNDIFEHIRKARIEALNREIKANMIIIDRDLAITNELYISDNVCLCGIVRPMILGLEVEYQKDLTKDFGFNFIITDGDTAETRIAELEKENAELRDRLRAIKEVLKYD